MRRQANTHLRQPVILRSETLLSPIKEKEKAKKLASLEDTILYLTAPLHNKQCIYDVSVFKGDGLSVILSLPLFYQEEIECTLHFNPKLNTQQASGVNTNFSLVLNVYSDSETRSTYEQLVRSQPGRENYSETEYSFDSEGNFCKLIELLDGIQTSREPFYKTKAYNIYRSVMTSEDFLYAERALTLIKDRLEDYRKWGK